MQGPAIKNLKKVYQLIVNWNIAASEIELNIFKSAAKSVN